MFGLQMPMHVDECEHCRRGYVLTPTPPPRKCSDIPDRVILEFLALHQGRWSTWGRPSHLMPSVFDVMPVGMPPKLELAKMRQLHRRGLVGGCPCGCRGDWEITDKGLASIGAARTKPYNGY